MTQNQLAYLQLQEANRHNQEEEGIKRRANDIAHKNFVTNAVKVGAGVVKDVTSAATSVAKFFV